MNVKIEPSWKSRLDGEFEKPYFAALVQRVRQEYAQYTCYPPGRLIFNAFNTCPFDKVKVVIIGQDPYHEPGQAMGLSFSVPDGVPMPPSLINIFKEIQTDLGKGIPSSGNLTRWAQQGVLLLNAILTVEAGKAASHSAIGWQTFTDAVIKCISDNCSGVVFMLWGNFARSKKDLIDSGKHFVLEAAHPSPLARGAFFGCGHFATANRLLEAQGKAPIDWKL